MKRGLGMIRKEKRGSGILLPSPADIELERMLIMFHRKQKTIRISGYPDLECSFRAFRIRIV